MSGRHSHTACLYKNSIIFFGGESNNKEDFDGRTFLNDIKIFNLDKNEWKILNGSGQPITGRKNHAAVVHDKNMFVYGGLDAKRGYLGELWTLNLSKIYFFEI